MLHRHPTDKESGFTLIELLVVILIIGILATIAIPMFLNQRKTAADSVTASDVKNISYSVETFFAKNQGAEKVDLDWLKANAKKSDGVEILIRGNHDDYCIEGRHSGGDQWKSGLDWASNGNQRPYYLYHSIGGGEIKNKGIGTSSLSCMNTNGAISAPVIWK